MTIRSLTVDANETVEICWEEHNVSGQVTDRYTERFSRPPSHVRQARRHAEDEAAAQRLRQNGVQEG
jgi:hypothetical protein